MTEIDEGKDDGYYYIIKFTEKNKPYLSKVPSKGHSVTKIEEKFSRIISEEMEKCIKDKTKGMPSPTTKTRVEKLKSDCSSEILEKVLAGKYKL